MTKTDKDLADAVADAVAGADAPTLAGAPAIGDIVARDHWDAYAGAGGETVTQFGQVVAVDSHIDAAGQPVESARVAWLSAVSDPIVLSELRRL